MSKDQNLVERWLRSPSVFVREALGAKPTSQQEQALELVRKLFWAKVLRGKLKGQLPAELAGYESKRGLSIMSGQGTGKDTFAAWFIIWALVCVPRVKMLATAPVAHQLKSVLWYEVSKWLNMRTSTGEYLHQLRELITVQNDKILLNEGGGKEAYCEGRTCNPKDNPDSQAETIAGRHDDFLFFLCDEASGIPDPVFRPIEGTLTGLCNFPVLIFNPTKRHGFAFKTHYGPDKENWLRLRWNAEDSERVTPEHIELMRTKYGRDSNVYRVRVQGLPPGDDEGSLIPWDWAMRAQEADFDVPKDEPIVFGCDIGRQGDPSVIVIRQGPKVLQILKRQEPDTVKTANWISEVAADWEPDTIYIDVIGLGWGVYDQLRARMSVVRSVDVSRAPMRSDKFDRLRDELWWTAREIFERGLISIPAHDELVGELTRIRYESTANGKVKIEAKKIMKARGLDSPNIADALVLTFAEGGKMFRGGGTSDEPANKRRYRREKEESSRFSWMTA